MSAVVKTVKKVFKVVGDVVKKVGDFVGDVVKAALDDPIGTIAKVAAVATGNAWAIPLIDGASVAIRGGDIGDVLKATATSYVAGKVGNTVGNAVGKAAATTAVNAGVSAGAAKIIGSVIGSASGSASVAIITGQDPAKAFLTGGLNAGVPAMLGKIDGFNDFSPSTQKAISSAITAQLSGQDPTGAIISGVISATGIDEMIKSSKIVGDAMESFEGSSGISLTESQKTILSDALMRSAIAALQGKDAGAAFMQSLTVAGTKALGDMVTEQFLSATGGLNKSYADAEKIGGSLESNISKQKAAADQFNSVKGSLDGAIAEQNRLYSAYTSAKATFDADSKNESKYNTAQKALNDYNAYVTNLNKAYGEYYKPTLDSLENELATLQTEYTTLTGKQSEAMEALKKSADSLQTVLDPVYFTSERAMVEALDPEFDANFYAQANGLDDPRQAYEHYLSQGMTSGVITNPDEYVERAFSALPEFDKDFYKEEYDAALNAAKSGKIGDVAKAVDAVNKSWTTDDEARAFLRKAYDDIGMTGYEPSQEEVDALRGQTEQIANTSSNQYAAGRANETLNSVLQDPDSDERSLQALVDAGYLSKDYISKATGKSYDDVIGALDRRITSQEEAEQYIKDAYAAAGIPDYKPTAFEITAAMKGDEDAASSFAAKNAQTNQKIFEAANNYKAITGLDVPSHIMQKALESSVDGREEVATNYVNAALRSAEKESQNQSKVIESVLSAYRAEGYTDEQINEKIDNGEAAQYVERVLQNNAQTVQNLRDYAKYVGEEKGQDSEEYKAAYRDALNAMAEHGGYDVYKDDNGNFVTAQSGQIDSNTLQPSEQFVRKSGGYMDPVTGTWHIHIYGHAGSEGKLVPSNEIYDEKNIAAFFSYGDSARPPEDGGASVFGSGSGVSQGLFAALTPIAIDSGTGAQLFDGNGGFALISYADGHGAVVKKDTNEVIWVDQQQINDLLNTVPVQPPYSDTVSKEPIEKPEIKDPVDSIKDEINSKFQNADEVKKALEASGYTPTDEEIKNLVGEKSLEQLTQEVEAYVDPRQVTFDEAKQFLEESGYAPTDEEVQQFVGQYLEEQQKTAAQEYSAPRMVTFADAKKYLEDAGYKNPSDEEVQRFAGQMNDAAYKERQQAAASEYAAPRVVTEEEARQFFADLGYEPTKEQIDQFVRQSQDEIQDQVKAELADFVNPRQVTQAEAEQFFKDLGYNFTPEEVAQFVRQNPEAIQDAVRGEVGEYVDPRMVSEQEARDAYAALGLKRPTADDVAKLVGQYAQEELGAKAELNLDAARYNSLLEQIENLGAQSGVDPAVLDAIKQDLNAQIEALGGDVSKLSGEVKDVASQIGNVESALTQAIADAKAAGLEGDAALKAAIDAVAADQQISSAELLAKLGTTESQLRADLASQIGGVQTQITGLGESVDARIAELMQQGADQYTATQQAIAEIQAQNQGLAETLGRPQRQVGQEDIDALTRMLAGEQDINLAYDVTGDQQITQDDLDFLTRVAAGQEVDWKPSAQSPWAATGVYGQLAQQQQDYMSQLAAMEEQRKADAAAAQAAALERDRLAQIRSLAGQGATQLQGLTSQLPTLAQQATQVKRTPIYGRATKEFNLASPLDVGFLGLSPEKQASQNTSNTTKIATGGYLDDLLDLL